MPSSPRKIASSRANGTKSHGPNSESGKQASAPNALTHGLTPGAVVLFNESQDDYQAQVDGHLDHFHPHNKPEADLDYQLAAAHWRIARYAGVESGLLEERMVDQEEMISENYNELPENHRLAIPFDARSGSNSALSLLNRYQSRLQHEYQRILKMIRQMRSFIPAGE